MSDAPSEPDARETRPTPCRGGIRPGWGKVLVLLVVGVIGFVLAMRVDHWAWVHLTWKHAEAKDWFRLLRVLGYTPTWIIAAVLLTLHFGIRPSRERWHPAIILIITVAASGLLSELLKMISKRLRPEHGDGFYTWHTWAEDAFSTSGIGLPSGHVITAMAAVFVLSRLYPRTAPVWLMLGLGCAYSRILAGAHYVSDAWLSIIVSFAVARSVWYYAHVPSHAPDLPASAAAGDHGRGWFRFARI